MKRCLGCMETYKDELNICPYCGYVENSMPEEAIHMIPGTILHKRYIVGKVVGFGGFGVTYVAWDSVLQKRIAIKEYLPSEFSTRMPGKPQLTVFNGDKAQQFNDGMKKFLEEARRLAKFQDEQGIVKIYDCFEENDTAYIIMEYLEGVTLAEYLKDTGPLPEKAAIQMMMPIMKSLKTVHASGIIHRDIAPDNIMISTDSQIKLIDFGAARYATTSHSRSLTVIVKPGYSPEEQYRSRGDQGSHTDVYSVGAVLYKMITGKTPPDAMERRAYFENGHKDILDSPDKYAGNISNNTKNAILNAMNVRIEDRTPDMDVLIGELTSEDEVVRRSGKIRKIDVLKWPLWMKIAIPSAFTAIITLMALFFTGVIGFHVFSPRDIYIPDGMTRVPRIIGMEESDAQVSLEKKQLQLVISGKQYDEQIAGGCILTQTMTVGSVVPVNYNLGVVISAGVRTVEVPFVTGMEKETAISELETNELSYEIIEDYDSVFLEGCVCAQGVAGGTAVHTGTVITLTVSLGRDPNVEYDFTEGKMPDISGLPLDEAKKLCEKQGIIVIVSEYRYSEDYDAMCVLEQSIAPGKDIQADAVIEAAVSKGKMSYIVPDVVYFTEEEAVAKLGTRGLAYEIGYAESENVAEGCVISQSIEAGVQADKDTKVGLVVSSGPPKFDMIDVVGKQHEEAERMLHELGLIVTVDYVYDEAYELGTVVEQSEKKGAKVYKGYEIMITVVSDEALIKVPDATGKSYAEAVQMIEAAGFRAEKNEIYDSETEAGRIIAQTPSAGSSQKKETKILLTVSLGREPIEVRFDAAGGQCPTASKTVYAQDTYGELPMPTLEYHTFLGWYTGKSSGTKVESGTQVESAGSHTLYARWERIYVKVSFDANDGSAASGAANIALGEKYTLPEATRQYHTFDGWYTAATGGDRIDQNTVLTNRERHTLYAHWTVRTVNVTYDADGGTMSDPAKATYKLGTAYGKRTAARSGYTFVGWYTEKNGKGSKILDTTVVTNEVDHTLYAYWSNEVCTVKFEPNGGKVDISSTKAVYDCPYGTLPTPTRTGYDFAGWYTQANGGSEVTESMTVQTTDTVTLYARWSNAKYIVTFNADGGSCATASQSAEYAKAYGTLPTPTRTGYTFDGWYTAATGGSKVNSDTVYNTAGNTTLYARWEKVFVTEIQLETNPAETVYYIGDKVSAVGAVMKVTYNDGTTASISGSDCEVTYPDMSTDGNKTVKLGYGGKDISYAITVKKPSISIGGGSNGSRTSTLTASYDVGKQQSIKINWSSSDTSVATVDSNGKVTFNKDKNSNASSTITASYVYMGKTYSATRTVSISYGSWSSWSTTAVSANDTRQVQTKTSTRTKTSGNPSESGWTQIKKEKSYTSGWVENRYTTQQTDTGIGTEYELVKKEYRYWHYHNIYNGCWNIDSVAYGNNVGFDEHYSSAELDVYYMSDQGGQAHAWGDNRTVKFSCGAGFTAWWREDSYLYRHRTYVWIYTHSQNYTEYSSRTINYTY